MAENEGDDIMSVVKEFVDFSVVSDNILGIADFVMEKHEYKHDVTLTDAQREQAAEKIKEALWAQVEALNLRRKTVLQEMFDNAEKALQDVLNESD